MDWTDEKIEELKGLWASGASCTRIGAAMNITRSAVIGKVHRLNLAQRAPRMNPQQKEKRRQQEIAKRVERQRATRANFAEKQMQELPPAPPPFAGALNIPFGDLRPHSSIEPNECRYVAAGGPDYLACGTPTLPGESYCGHCKGVVYYRGVQLQITEDDREVRRARARNAGKMSQALNPMKIAQRIYEGSNLESPGLT